MEPADLELSRRDLCIFVRVIRFTVIEVVISVQRSALIDRSSPAYTEAAAYWYASIGFVLRFIVIEK
jgi:hypothetical protein